MTNNEPGQLARVPPTDAESSEKIDDIARITAALAAPFDPSEVKFKPGAINSNRALALALAYIDARAVQDRLDDVLGIPNWQDDYSVLPTGDVVCTLRLRLNGEWITKVDVGAQSEQPDESDRMKAAFSDALKRAAVKFGVFRYGYRLPAQWRDWDPQRRTWKEKPTLPVSAPNAYQPVPPPEPKQPPPLDRLREAAEKGMPDLERAWRALNNDQRKACSEHLAALKARAAEVAGVPA